MKSIKERANFIPRPAVGSTAYGGLYGKQEIENYTGLTISFMRYMHRRFAFPLLKLPGGIWYLHKDLFYMWCLSAQRQQLIEFHNVAPGVVVEADALKRLEILKQDMALRYGPEEAEMFRRIYRRVFGPDEAIDMVTGHDGNDGSEEAPGLGIGPGPDDPSDERCPPSARSDAQFGETPEA